MSGLVEQSEHTQHLPIKFAILYRHSSWYPKTVTTLTSKITDHDHQNNYNNDEKFELLQELPKCDTET